MPNTIYLAKKYTFMLDEVYKETALTAVLDGAENLMREGYNADEIVIPMLSMDGLGDYSRNSGYTGGDATLTWETVKTNFDRGRKFQIDELDNIETGGVAFGRLGGEFVRTKVVPELDAFRFAKYASTAGISKAEAVLSSGADVISALRACANKFDEDEVPYEERILFITPTLLGLVQDLDTTKSREVLSRFALIVKVPQTRFYTAITQYDGKTNSGGIDQRPGGYVKKTSQEEATFTGDGSTTTFTVTAKPERIDSVTVDGSAVTPEGYDASTGVVTLSTAPASTKAVVVKYGKARNLNFMCIHKPASIQFNKLVKPKILTPEVNPDGDLWIYGYRLVSLCDVYQNKVAGIYAHIDPTVS